MNTSAALLEDEDLSPPPLFFLSLSFFGLVLVLAAAACGTEAHCSCCSGNTL